MKKDGKPDEKQKKDAEGESGRKNGRGKKEEKRKENRGQAEETG